MTKKASSSSFSSSCRLSALQGQQQGTGSSTSTPEAQANGTSIGGSFGVGGRTRISSERLHSLIEDVLALIEEDEDEFEDWGPRTAEGDKGNQRMQ